MANFIVKLFQQLDRAFPLQGASHDVPVTKTTAHEPLGDSTGIVVTDAARLSSLSSGQGGVLGLVAGIVAGEVAGAVSRNHKYADDDVLVDLHQPARVLFVDHPDVDKHYISIRLTVKYTDALKTFKQRDLVKIVKLDNGEITIAKYE